MYQTIACRLEARASLYQTGGAIGFRDQLQDSVNMLTLDAHYALERILDCCRHQYSEGDVMHWWHENPEGDRGVRTRCSDDLLWLVWALCEYTDATGDYEICSLSEPFIESPPLQPDEHDRYETAVPGAQSGSVLDHALRAIECAVSRGFDDGGLPLMLAGDWNDAMNEIGGGSVWLAWFMGHCALRLALLLEKLCKPDSERYHALAASIALAADRCFNGEYYIRARFPDGEAVCDGGRIDSIAQSWAVLSGLADEHKARIAVQTALRRLVDREHGIVKLLDPPFTPDERRVGYISGYGAGFRENGGQYTHAAIWLAQAAIRLGMREEGMEILKMLLPENHNSEVYEAEPFVLPADVSAAKGFEGRAGWTWYTGSAGWYYRAVRGLRKDKEK